MRIPVSLAVATIALGASAAVLAGPATAAPQPPSAESLRANLQLALDGDALHLESGSASGMREVKTKIDKYTTGGYNWRVDNVGPVTGNSVKSILQSCYPLAGCFPIQQEWKYLNGTWKLSSASETELVTFSRQV